MTKFKRGDKVNFKGNEKFSPAFWTYVWAVNQHEMDSCYIQHLNGNISKSLIRENGGFEDGFESPHSSNFKAGLRYICVTENELELAK